MGNIVKIFSDTGSVLTGVVIILLISVVAQVADGPLLEAITQIDVQGYQVDDNGRIMDSDGRVRGWVKGNDVYSPDLELRYRVAGRRLEDAP